MGQSSQPQSANSLSGYQIELTSKLMRQRFKRALRNAAVGVTIDQWVLLNQLAKQDGISQLELATAVHKDPPTVTRIIDILVEGNYIRRGADTNDRRKFLIHLSPKGKSTVAKIIPLVQDFRSQVFANISKPDLQQFQKTLDVIFRNLQ